MVLSEEERVSSSRWLILSLIGIAGTIFLLALLFGGINSFLNGENVYSLIFFAAFVFLSLGFFGFLKKYWSDFTNSFLNFLVNVFFPAVSQEGMFTMAVLSILIFVFYLFNLNSAFNFEGLSFDAFFLKAGTFMICLLILLFLPIFATELYYVMSVNRPSESFIKKVVYANTLTMFSLGFVGGVHFFITADEPAPLMMVGTLIFFVQGGIVFLMMLFRNKFEDRILEFRVIYEEPPAGTLKVVFLVILVPFLFFKIVMGTSVLFAAFNTIGFPMVAALLMKWDKFRNLYYRLFKGDE